MSKIKHGEEYTEMWRIVNPVSYENVSKIMPGVDKKIMDDLKDYYISLNEYTMLKKDLSTVFNKNAIRKEMKQILKSSNGLINEKELLKTLTLYKDLQPDAVLTEEAIKKIINDNKIEKVNKFINYLLKLSF